MLLDVRRRIHVSYEEEESMLYVADHGYICIICYVICIYTYVYMYIDISYIYFQAYIYIHTYVYMYIYISFIYMQVQAMFYIADH